MRMGTDDYKNEFIGEIVKYCVDGEYIWFYDEISGGLYQLNTKSCIVEVVLTPMEIHQEKIFPVTQILKWKNKVYLIPNNISYDWLVYDIVDKHLSSVLLSSQSYEVDIAENIGKWIYLIPEKTNHVLAIVDAETLNVKMITTDWYRDDNRELECWGYSLFEDIILFPIIGTREIFRIQGEQIIKLSLQIKQLIYSISLNKDGIWILPSEGDAIFFVDENGEFIDSVDIWTNGYKEAAERFARIIAIDRYVYLFPKQGGEILVLETNKKKWTALGDKNAHFYRPLFQKTESVSTYWGYNYNEGRLYTLPLIYRYAEIIENKSLNYKVLRYAATLMAQQYMSWVYWLNGRKKIYFAERGKESLKSFCKIALEHKITDSKKDIGKNIWMADKNEF